MILIHFRYYDTMLSSFSSSNEQTASRPLTTQLKYMPIPMPLPTDVKADLCTLFLGIATIEVQRKENLTPLPIMVTVSTMMFGLMLIKIRLSGVHWHVIMDILKRNANSVVLLCHRHIRQALIYSNAATNLEYGANFEPLFRTYGVSCNESNTVWNSKPDILMAIYSSLPP